jgi:hypothetical protein
MQFGYKPLLSLLDSFDPSNLPAGNWLPELAQMLHRPATPTAPSSGQTGILGQAVLYTGDDDDFAGSGARAGSVGQGGTTAVTSKAGTSSFVINISWDASVANAPSAFVSGVLAAVQESEFSNPITMNITVGYGEADGYTLGAGTLGANLSYLVQATYSAVRNALANDASPAAESALASLPASSPTGGNVWLTTAQAKALGLLSGSGTSIDGYVGFSNSLPFTYNDTAGVASGTYDFFGVAVHELTEVMGRLLLTGETVGGVANSYDLLDLYHYSSPGVRDFSSTTPGYFSANGGNANLGNFNTVAGGDPGDWGSSMGYNSFDAFSYSSVVNTVTASDLEVMNALGWNPPGTVATIAPKGFSVTPNVSGDLAAQSATGLAAKAQLATLTEIGAAAGDTIVFTSGGSYAGDFTLTNSNNGTATLSIGAGGLPGATNGLLYNLALAANDVTDGKSSPVSSIGVVVGSGNSDTISLASLSGSLGTGMPEFVYGLGGADTINGSGMTSSLWIIGGAGADTMTGGSGPNDYMYGATSDSTATAMDLITNFHTATDVIDLRGLGESLRAAGRILGSTLAADSVGWQTSGGNTYVYVNTAGTSERLTAPSMKIELAGSLQLTSSDIAHL